MELASVKSELSPRNHRLLMMDCEANAAKCVKRRRRDSSMAVIGGNQQQGQQLEQQPQGGQSTPTTSYEADIGGLEGLKPIYGTKGPGIPLRRRKESKVDAEHFIYFTLIAYLVLIMLFLLANTCCIVILSMNVDFLLCFWDSLMVISGAYNDEEAAARAYDLAALKYWGASTFTNFPVCIRWLRPGAHSTASQEQKPSTDLQPFTTSNPIQTRGTTEVSNFKLQPLPSGELDSTKKQDFSKYMTPLSPCNKSSSPTALGLLLKSSVFRELVQRNLNSVNEEAEEVELKYSQDGSDGIGGTFDNGITSNSYLCSSNINKLPNLESREESTLPMYHKNKQSLWSGAFNMSD